MYYYYQSNYGISGNLRGVFLNAGFLELVKIIYENLNDDEDLDKIHQFTGISM